MPDQTQQQKENVWKAAGYDHTRVECRYIDRYGNRSDWELCDHYATNATQYRLRIVWLDPMHAECLAEARARFEEFKQ